MVNYTEDDYKRAITHNAYRHGDKKTKKGGSSRMLSKRITHDKYVSLKSSSVGSKKNILFVSDSFMEVSEPKNVLPYWGGGYFFLCSL